MRYIRYFFFAVLAVALVSVAVANRDSVTLQLLPEALSRLAGLNRTIELPLYAAIFGGIAAGLLIGFVWEWMREGKYRAEAARHATEVRRLNRELRRVKGQRDEGKDDVLALLDEAS